MASRKVNGQGEKPQGLHQQTVRVLFLTRAFRTQLLGELFREQRLADSEVGLLVTLDAIFEVLHSALDADVQTTLSRIVNDPQVRHDALAQRARHRSPSGGHGEGRPDSTN